LFLFPRLSLPITEKDRSSIKDNQQLPALSMRLALTPLGTAARLARRGSRAAPSVVAAVLLASIQMAAHAQQPDLTAGRALFVKRCSVCHGEKADGNSNLAKMLDPKPANLLVSKLDSAARNQIIRKGGAAVGRSSVMPNWEAELSEAELRDVIGYVATLPPARPVAAPDKDRVGQANSGEPR
jgi:mono/diheme cytochrome c family protein